MNTLRDILIIEDEPAVTSAVARVCREEGMSVVAVDNASAALDLLSEHRFRLVLCDIMLPGMDGFGFLEAMEGSGDQTPVVMMTGYSTVENAVKSLTVGAVDYIAKPFTADELLTVIRRSFRSAWLLDEAESAGLRPNPTVSYVPCPADYHRLGYVSWVLMEDEGTARIGISDLFLKAAEGITAIELAEPGEDLLQGVACAVLISPDGSEHGVMCPMSGNVLEVNAEVQSTPSLVEKDPYFRGWIYRILPSDPEMNLRWLGF